MPNDVTYCLDQAIDYMIEQIELNDHPFADQHAAFCEAVDSKKELIEALQDLERVPTNSSCAKFLRQLRFNIIGMRVEK